MQPQVYTGQRGKNLGTRVWLLLDCLHTNSLVKCILCSPGKWPRITLLLHQGIQTLEEKHCTTLLQNGRSEREDTIDNASFTSTYKKMWSKEDHESRLGTESAHKIHVPAGLDRTWYVYHVSMYIYVHIHVYTYIHTLLYYHTYI